MNRELYQQPELYDLIHAGFDEDIEFYAQVVGTGTVWELFAGSGRVTVPLAERGATVTAVDASPEMIAAGKRYAAGRGDAAQRIEWIEDRLPGYWMENRFQTAIAPLHSLSHILAPANVLVLLQQVYWSLVPGGRFAFAVHNPDPAVLSRDPEKIYKQAEYHDPGGDITVYQKSGYDTAEQILSLVWYIEDREQTRSISYRLRMFFPEELVLLVTTIGFEIEHRFGWYDRRPLTGECGTQILVCRRPD